MNPGYKIVNLQFICRNGLFVMFPRLGYLPFVRLFCADPVLSFAVSETDEPMPEIGREKAPEIE